MYKNLLFPVVAARFISLKQHISVKQRCAIYKYKHSICLKIHFVVPSIHIRVDIFSPFSVVLMFFLKGLHFWSHISLCGKKQMQCIRVSSVFILRENTIMWEYKDNYTAAQFCISAKLAI